MSLITSMILSGASSGGGVGLTGATYSAFSSANPAYLYLTLFSNGTFQRWRNSGNFAIANWYTPTTTSIGASYEVKVTPSVGSLDVGTAGTWQVLSSDRTFGIEETNIDDTKECTFTMDIRRQSDSVLVASAVFTLSVTRT